MWSYIIRRCLLMVPTFIGITALSFTVMQVAGEHAYEKELMLLTGASQGGEGTAGSSTGKMAHKGLSLAQFDRIRARYELDMPIVINLSPQDRSDRILEALHHAVAPMPHMDLGPLKAMMTSPDSTEILAVVRQYELDAQDASKPWNLEESFINSIGGRLPTLSSSAAIEKVWLQLQGDLSRRRQWRASRERSKLTLETMAARLIPVLAQEGDSLDDAMWQRGLSEIKDQGLAEGLTDRASLRAFWAPHAAELDVEALAAQMDQWLGLNEDSDKALDLEDRIFKWKSCVAEAAFLGLAGETDAKRLLRRLKAFERATGCDSIPYIETPDEASLKAAVTEARKWWRTHELEFVEIGPLRRLWSTVRETRYGRWFADMVHLDFRESRTQGKPVMEAIAERLPVSVQFGLIGFILSYFVCIPLGVIKAVRHGTPFDFVSSALVFVGYSIPGWAFGFILLVVFGGGTFESLNWFPLQGFKSDNYETLDLWHKILDRAHHAVLPVLAYSIGSFATLTVLMKNSLLENLGADYVRTAFAKGLSERRVIFVHTLRNSLIPLCTMLGHLLSFALAGSYLVESVFNINGFGLLGFKAVLNYDINLMMGSLVIGAVLQLTGNLFSDLLYCAVDPRIRFS